MNERLWELLTDSFWQILIPGLTMTIPLTVISFALAMVIAVVVALIQFANIQGLKQVARFYIWVIRGTPLLVQLFLVFYGLYTYIYWAAGHRHRVRSVSGGGNRVLHQRGRLLRRDDARGAGSGAGRTN